MVSICMYQMWRVTLRRCEKAAAAYLQTRYLCMYQMSVMRHVATAHLPRLYHVPGIWPRRCRALGNLRHRRRTGNLHHHQQQAQGTYIHRPPRHHTPQQHAEERQRPCAPTDSSQEGCQDLGHCASFHWRLQGRGRIRGGTSERRRVR